MFGPRSVLVAVCCYEKQEVLQNCAEETTLKTSCGGVGFRQEVAFTSAPYCVCLNQAGGVNVTVM